VKRSRRGVVVVAHCPRDDETTKREQEIRSAIFYTRRTGRLQPMPYQGMVIVVIVIELLSRRARRPNAYAKTYQLYRKGTVDGATWYHSVAVLNQALFTRSHRQKDIRARRGRGRDIMVSRDRRGIDNTPTPSEWTGEPEGIL